MNTQSFDAVTRRAVEGISRRRSLLTLGGAAVAATVARPSASEAKKKGKDCKKKEKQRCNSDAAACKTTVQVSVCPGADPAVCIAAQTCCESCSATSFLNCLAALVA